MVQSVRKRLEYIDAARGLAIFTVVYSHICLFCIPCYESSSLAIGYLRMYYLNAFFFISGLLAVKTKVATANYLPLIWKRLCQLLIPALIVGLVYASSHRVSFEQFIFDDAKNGYWFTISLFEMFVLYYTLAAILNRFFKQAIVAILFMTLSFGLYFVSKSHIIPIEINGLLCWGNTIFYLPFFSLGILVSIHKSLVHRIVSIEKGKIATMLFIIVWMSYYLTFPLMVQRIAVVLLFIYVIYKIYSRPRAGKLNGVLRKILLFIGTNSLEIYFIHYFLLFPLPLCAGKYLDSVSNTGRSLSMPEFIIVGSLSVVISIASVLLARILKKIPYVALLAFGKRAVA